MTPRADAKLPPLHQKPSLPTPRGPPPSRPLVKKRPHRRSPQACDECRLRKRACDAADPCGPCRRGDLQCTYQFRRPAPPPTLRIRELQDHLRLARQWMQKVKDHGHAVPGLDLDECLRTLDFTQPEPEASSPTTPHSDALTPQPAARATAADQTPKSTPMLPPGTSKYGNMLLGCERLGSIPQSSYFYGPFSDLSFISRIVELFRNTLPESKTQAFDQIRGHFAQPLSDEQSAPDAAEDASWDELPLDAGEALDAALEAPDLLLSCLPSDELKACLVSDAPPMAAEMRTLLRVVLALGYTFDANRHRETGCQVSTSRGYKQLLIAMGNIGLVASETLESLQSLLCIVTYYMATARMTAAHSVISTACSLATRLGLLTKAMGPVDITPSHRTRRTRTLLALITLDMQLSLILDLPQHLPDHVFSSARLGELITEAEAQQDVCTTAMLRQIALLAIPISVRYKTLQNLETAQNPDQGEIILLEAAHTEFRQWKRSISPLLTSLGSSHQHQVIKKNLEAIYNFSQIIVFRTHLHHLRDVAVGGSMSMAQSYHALACLKLATSTIVNFANESYGSIKGSWLSIYTVFTAVTCLIFLIAAHPGTSNPSVAWQRALRGIRIIGSYTCGDNLATACLNVLKTVTLELRHTVWFDYPEIHSTVPSVCENKWTPAATPMFIQDAQTMHETPKNTADRMLVQADSLASDFSFRDILNMSDSD